MTRRCLLVDLRVSGVSLGFASADKYEADDALLLDDGTGRSRLPLASASLWSERNSDGEEEFMPVDTRVALVKTLLAREEIGQTMTTTENEEEIFALKSLLSGLTQYAESRLEKELHELVVLVPSCASDAFRQLVTSAGDRVSFGETRTYKRSRVAMTAYKIDRLYCGEMIGYIITVDVDSQGATLTVESVEEGIYEQMEAIRVSYVEGDDSVLEQALVDVLERTRVPMDQVNGVVLIGELSKFETEGMTPRLEDLLPQATMYNSIPATEVTLCGAVEIMRLRLEPVIHHGEIIGCLDPVRLSIGVETVGGMMTTVIPRNTLLPCMKTARLRVYCESEATTSVELRFCEGERVFARDNTPLGSLTANGLTVGWSEIDVRVEVSYDLEITIDATLVSSDGSRSLRLELLSPTAQMGGDEIAAYLDLVESLQTRAQEESARDQTQIELCTEELVRSVSLLCGRPVPPGVLRADQLLLSTHHVFGPCASGFESRAGNLLDGIGLGDRHALSTGLVHDALLELLDGQIVWSVYGSRRCPQCVTYEEQRRLIEAAD